MSHRRATLFHNICSLGLHIIPSMAISAKWESELGRLRQEDQEFKAGLGYIAKPWRGAGKSVDVKALSLLYY